jgi:putative ABC transport system permease protein
MNYRESLWVGLEGLKSHKLRSTLTMLGIIFGVAAVVAMLSIGEGAKRAALEQIQLMGINNIIIQDIPVDDADEGKGRTNLSRGLTLDDAWTIEKLNPLVEISVPERTVIEEVRFGSENIETHIVGTMPDFELIMNCYPEQGAFFNYLDVQDARRVCVLGADIKKNLFFFKDPLGEKVKIGKQWYTVVGVMEKKPVLAAGTSSVRDPNLEVYVPLTCTTKRFPHGQFESEIDRITVRVVDPDRIQETANIIKKAMERRHNNIPDFHITVPEALLHQREQTQRIFNIVMGAIAGISLLVGGIGIMNIMLATVLERTREIGIRRAVGATRRDILGQFLVEALVLSVLGGLVGIVLGFAMTKVITLYAAWKTAVSIPAIVLAFLVSATVGVVFGLFPARKASLLDPIESLRYE